MIEINGVIEADEPLDPDTFLTEFIQWVESKNYRFGGAIGPYKDEDDDNHEE